MEATGGFEPPNRGFADLRLSPLGYVASIIGPNFGGLVPRAGLEPTRAYAHGPLKTACLPIPPPRPVPERTDYTIRRTWSKAETSLWDPTGLLE